ncbi:hypothetical protein B0H11DRAFT_2095954 [Mycena galericulata]|nr:hypothetical protein B0H11DRAFT_2095954 [Mycena galericulata]
MRTSIAILATVLYIHNNRAGSTDFRILKRILQLSVEILSRAFEVRYKIVTSAQNRSLRHFDGQHPHAIIQPLPLGFPGWASSSGKVWHWPTSVDIAAVVNTSVPLGLLSATSFPTFGPATGVAFGCAVGATGEICWRETRSKHTCFDAPAGVGAAELARTSAKMKQKRATSCMIAWR